MEIHQILRNLPPHLHIVITDCERIPENVCDKTILGWPKGADEQFRCVDRVHLHRYIGRGLGRTWCLAHRDYADPREDLLKHLAYDLLKIPVFCGKYDQQINDSAKKVCLAIRDIIGEKEFTRFFNARTTAEAMNRCVREVKQFSEIKLAPFKII